MTSPLPRTIIVGPHRYRLAFEEDPRTENDGYLFGECQHDTLLIRIRRGLPADMERTVVWHEVLHAICEVTGAGWAANCDLSSEEVMVRNLAPMIVDVLRRNPKLAAYLTAK